MSNAGRLKEQAIAVDDVTLDLKQAAARTGLSPLTLRQKAVYRHEMAFYRVGRRLVFRLSDIEAFMRRCRVEAR